MARSTWNLQGYLEARFGVMPRPRNSIDTEPSPAIDEDFEFEMEPPVEKVIQAEIVRYYTTTSYSPLPPHEGLSFGFQNHNSRLFVNLNCINNAVKITSYLFRGNEYVV